MDREVSKSGASMQENAEMKILLPCSTHMKDSCFNVTDEIKR
jgi:hypothetical protein